jgi:hypothetical protein
MRTIGFEMPREIKGIYVKNSNRIVGIPLFRQKGQEFREHSSGIELWQVNGDGHMHLKRRWRKKSIGFIEYSDIPNTWVQPRAFQNS